MTLLLVNVNFKLWILRTALLTNHHFLDLLFLLFPACLPQQQSCRSIISWDIWTTCQCVMDSQGHACLLYHPSWFVHASSLVNLIFDSAQQKYFVTASQTKKNTKKIQKWQSHNKSRNQVLFLGYISFLRLSSKIINFCTERWNQTRTIQNLFEHKICLNPKFLWSKIFEPISLA